jgi:RNA polymerase sigma factor (sigma-70 family)
MSDQEIGIWQAFQNGNKDAFETILRIYYRPMFDYGFRFQNDHDQLSDDIHDLFLNLWDRRAFLNPTTNFKLYLFSALRNQIFRSKKRLHNIEELSEEDEEVQYLEDDYAESKLIIVEAASERHDRINFILGKLTKRQQEILHLRFFENLTTSQISTVLNLSEASVYNLLSISLKLFRSLWNKHFAILSAILVLIKVLLIS